MQPRVSVPAILEVFGSCEITCTSIRNRILYGFMEYVQNMKQFVTEINRGSRNVIITVAGK